MSTESTKNPSDTSMTDLSKEIGIAEELCKQALEKFKQVSMGWGAKSGLGNPGA